MEDLQLPCSSIRAHYGERSTAAPLDVEKCSHETTAGPGETHSESSSWSHEDPEDEANFFD
eukprot:6923686-Prorocentrum_lima.AAC.1